MLSRLTKIQLTLFVIVTAVALTLMAANYVQIPAMLGFGRFDVKVQLPNTGGLYPKSVVTYRGHEVGTVKSVDLRAGGGVVATVQVDEDADIPKDTEVEVRSASVIGEQYIIFVPTGGGEVLEEGDVVEASRTSIPVATDDLIESARTFLDSVPIGSLQTTVSELGDAFADNGGDLGRLIDEGASFQEQANDNLASTLRLIDQAAPVLATQQGLDGDIRAWANDLSGFTGQLSDADQDIEKLLSSTAPFATEAATFMDGLQPILPGLLTDIGATAEVADVYLPALHHLLTVTPAAVVGLSASINPETRNTDYTTLNLSFKTGINVPPVCQDGFADRDKVRSAKELDYDDAPAPRDSYCKVPRSDPRIVRGARNQVCPTKEVRYGATAALCGLVFNQVEVDREKLLAAGSDPGSSASAAGKGASATLDPATGRLLAPNGEFFLFDKGAVAQGDDSFAGMITGLVRP
ncbi:MAG: hypothetical protein JWP31_1263 [Aeromicrobium sp.]|nr:hypothetical protein [Aeromicrobium sp.]